MTLVGTGLSERIRSTVIAMLGVTAAASLALMLFLYQTSLPMPSLGPLTFPAPGQAGIQRGVALGDPGATSPSIAAAARAGGGAATPTAVAVPVSATDTTPTSGSPAAADLGGSAPGVHQGQGTSGGSQPATPAPNTPVHQPSSTAEPEAPAPEPAPVAVPVSQPAPAPEPPAVPAGEEPPVEELPGVEEPPLEEGEENPIVEEESEEPLFPAGDPGAASPTE